jgi:hypothetical protein
MRLMTWRALSMRPYPAASSGTAAFTAANPVTAASTPADALQTKRCWNMSQQGWLDRAASLQVPIVDPGGDARPFKAVIVALGISGSTGRWRPKNRYSYAWFHRKSKEFTSLDSVV